VDGAIRKLFAGQSIKLLQRADATAWYRSGTPSFWKTFLRFHLTVSSVMPIASDLLIRRARRDQAHNFRFAGSPHRCTRRRPRAIGIGAPGKVLNELLDIACEFRVGPARGQQAMEEVQHLLPPVDNRADKAQLGAAKQRCAKMFGRPIGSDAGLVDPGSQEIDCDERRLATEPLCLRRDPVELGESRWIVAFGQRDARARAAGDVRGNLRKRQKKLAFSAITLK